MPQGNDAIHMPSFVFDPRALGPPHLRVREAVAPCNLPRLHVAFLGLNLEDSGFQKPVQGFVAPLELRQPIRIDR